MRKTIGFSGNFVRECTCEDFAKYKFFSFIMRMGGEGGEEGQDLIM